MKRFINKLFSKLVLGVFIIALQFGWFVYLIYSATVASSVVNIALQVFAVALALYVSNKDMRTSYKMSWIFLILFLPLFGLPAYFIFGRSELTRHARHKMKEVNLRVAKFKEKNTEVRKQIQKLECYAGQQAYYLENSAGYPPYREEESCYYPSGEEAFPQLLNDLKNAKKFIFLEYFIIEPGEMFNSILEVLEQKVKEGIDVRLIYDDMGSIQTLPSGFNKVLQNKGIRCARFNPFRPLLSIIMNNRDHRKITVIDGRIAYTGGFNLADEYINKKERYGYWKDAGIRIAGSAVWSFTSMFLEMWDFIMNEESDYTFYKVLSKQMLIEQENTSDDVKEGAQEKGFVQPYSDSPLDHESVGENVYLNLIEHARKYVYIFTPYLIIGSEMKTALVNAAKCGVDVRIVVPEIPDKKLVYLLTQSNFEHLIKGGVKIYRFQPGFIHSKCFVVDDIYAAVGTINLDYRSLHLHFECGVSLYFTQSVMQVKNDAEKTFGQCHEVTVEESKNKWFIVRMFLGALKLFAPLL